MIFFIIYIHRLLSLSFSWDMIKRKKWLYFFISWIFFLLIWSLFFYTNADDWYLTLEVRGFGIRHGTPDNTNLWLLTTSGNEQELTGQFTDYFWVEDLQGYTTGHYTTIQCDGVYGPSWYILSWIYLKAGNITPELIQWLTGNHIFINSILNNYIDILSPITYIYKETHNDNAWLANRYGDKPYYKIIIPAYAPPGMYSGTIVFSFYMY